MSAIGTYLRERFPLATVAPLALATAAMLVGSGSNFYANSSYWQATGLIALTFLAFLLRTRITDEFKDARHDDLNYPGRPVQRGLVTRRQLIPIGLIALAIELASVSAVAVICNSSNSVLAYLGVLAFSALTAFEFFASSWLERHFNVYFFTHQLIFVTFSIWAATAFATDQQNLAWLGYVGFMAYMAAIEVVRKFEVRRSPQGKEVADTYLTVWGRSRCIWIMAALQAFASMAFWLSSPSVVPLLVAAVTLVAMLLTRRNDLAVRASVIFGFLVQSGVVFFS